VQISFIACVTVAWSREGMRLIDTCAAGPLCCGSAVRTSRGSKPVKTASVLRLRVYVCRVVYFHIPTHIVTASDQTIFRFLSTVRSRHECATTRETGRAASTAIRASSSESRWLCLYISCDAYSGPSTSGSMNNLKLFDI